MGFAWLTNPGCLRKSERVTKQANISGFLVEVPIPGKRRRCRLDGFLVPGAKNRPALIIVHGMHSNFYRARWKKALLEGCAEMGIGALSFNNRGVETYTNDERFRDCLADITAAVGLMRKKGYRHVVLVGHSTGCQKATYYQAVKKDPRVRGLVLLAIGDDLAIVRRDLGGAFSKWVRIAKRKVRAGRGSEPLGAPHIPPFSARRFLSIADPASVEARLFDFSHGGPRGWFERLQCPVLCVLAGRDEYETTPPAQMIDQLRRRYHGARFDACIVRGADHGFHDREQTLARQVLKWVGALARLSY
jgi:pimeloyl-ACP methyl ester carboxylesterase